MSKTETPDIVERLQTAIDDRGKGSVWGYAGLLEDATAEIERLRTELAKHQWRTMDDAPRDGEIVIVWCPADEDSLDIAHATLDFYEPAIAEWRRSRPDQQPTHWMPLPPPPPSPQGENDG